MSIYNTAISTASKLIDKFANPDTLTFKEYTRVSDGGGGFVSTTSTKFTARGVVLPLTSAEKLRSMQLQDESTHKAYIKKSAGTPTTDDFLTFKGTDYNITGVLNIAEADAAYVVFLSSGVEV